MTERKGRSPTSPGNQWGAWAGTPPYTNDPLAQCNWCAAPGSAGTVTGSSAKQIVPGVDVLPGRPFSRKVVD